MKDEGKSLFFYIISAVVMVFFIIWSIASFADANGFTMVSANFAAGRGAAGVFGLITSLLMLGIAILTPINVILFYRR
jgi:succinate dehydrogenase hydrophobic anchor subunit